MMFLSRGEVSASFVVFLCICLFLSKCKGEVGYDPAPTCKRLECPLYTVVHSERDFEIRRYNSSTWVSSPSIVASSYREGAGQGFKILRSYIKGNNREGAQINMTAPILVDVQKSSYTVYFYLPKVYQKSPPQPNSNSIKPVSLPLRVLAAVRRFDGLLTNEVIPKQVDALKKSLENSKFPLAVAQNSFTVAGYTAPFRLENRVNEVILWFG